jgi:hypothetical protein
LVTFRPPSIVGVLPTSFAITERRSYSFHRDDHDHAVPVLLNEHWFCTRNVVVSRADMVFMAESRSDQLRYLG